MPRLFVCALFFVLFPIDCCVFIKNRKKLLAIAMFHVNAHNFGSSKLKCYCSSFGNAWLSDLLVPSVRICYKCVFQVVCSFRWWVLLSAFQLYHFACRVLFYVTVSKHLLNWLFAVAFNGENRSYVMVVFMQTGIVCMDSRVSVLTQLS